MTDNISFLDPSLPNIIEHMPAVVFRLSHMGDNWRTMFVTQNVNRWGYTPEDFFDGSMTWFRLIHPDDRVLVSKTIEDYEAHNVNKFKLYYRIVKENGDVIPVTEYNIVNRDKEGNILCYDTVIWDSTQTEDSRRLIDDHYRQQVVLNDILMSLQDSDLAHALQIILDRTGEYLNTSRALLFKDSPDHKTCKIVYEWCNTDIESVMALDYSITYETGMPEIYIALQKTGNLLVNYGEIPENCREEFEAEGLVASAIFAVYLEGEHYGFVCFDDCIVERRWDDDTVRFLKNISNMISNVLARQNDQAAKQHYAAEIEKLAYLDHLTGLPNRYRCDSDLTEALRQMRRKDEQGYLLFIDMDDFKIVNDCYGHDYGDAILITFANWLKKTFPEPDKVFRFGGDEFVLKVAPEHAENIHDILKKLHTRAILPWRALNKEFYCTLSIGVVGYGGNEKNKNDIIKNADIAMYEAKRQGKNKYVFFDKSYHDSTLHRSQMESLLRSAMENNFKGFKIDYQPIVNMESGKMSGAEALLRMVHGDNIILPKEFLPLANYLGFIVPIGEYVLQNAAAECRKIIDLGLDDFVMTVNLSARQMNQQDINARIEEILADENVPYKNFAISVTESDAIEDIDRMLKVCQGLRLRHMKVVLDDFGGGNASFIHLRDLPIDIVNISSLFMQRLDEDYAKDFVELIIKLSHSMQKVVCINGIETQKQYDFSVRSGADMLQGFYLHKAENAEMLGKLI